MGLFRKSEEERCREAAVASKCRSMDNLQIIMAMILEHDAANDQAIHGPLLEEVVTRCGYDPYE